MKKWLFVMTFGLFLILTVGCGKVTTSTTPGDPHPDAYLDLSLFPQGLLGACDTEGNCGYLNEQGEVAIEFDFDRVSTFNKWGAAVVGKDGLQGVIDTSGSILLPIEYSGLVQANRPDGYGWVGMFQFEETWYFIAREGEEMGLLNQAEEWVFPAIFDDINCANYENSGWCYVRESPTVSYFQNLDGEKLLEGAVMASSPFNEDGLAQAIASGSLEDSLRQEYFIEPDGTNHFGATYSKALLGWKGNEKVLTFGMYDSETESIRYGILTKAGEILLPAEYEYKESNVFFNMTGDVLVANNEIGLLVKNLSGTTLYESTDGFRNMMLFTQGTESLTVLHKEGEYAALSDSGQIVIQPQPRRIYFFDAKNAVVVDSETHHCLLQSMEGEILYDGGVGFMYSTLDDSHRYFASTESGGYEMLGETGERLGTLELERVGIVTALVFSRGLMGATTDIMGKMGFIDLNGTMVIPELYDIPSFGTSLEGYFGKEGYAKVRKDGLYGVIDRQGNVIIDFEYISILESWSF